MQISMLFPTVNFYFIGFFTWVSCIFKWPENYICYFQSDVMHLTEDATKLKLFMDVLDGTKAAVRHHGITFFLVIYVVSFLASLLFFSSFYTCFTFKHFLPLSADITHVCALSAYWIHDGHSSTHPPQTVEKVCIHAFESLWTAHRISHLISLTNCSLAVTSVVATAPDILSPLSLILESILQADQQMMERTKAKIFSALISVLQIQGKKGCCPYLNLMFQLSAVPSPS